MFARFATAALGFAALAACQTVQTPGTASSAPMRADRPLLFADEFDTGTLDREKWNVVGPDFWVNNEQQAYIDDPATVRFTGTSLLLTPQFREDYPTPDGRQPDFVSGRINTRGHFDFTYGRAEARIRMPDAVGAWPAFWLLGNGRWPQTGEIDIMEYVGEKDWVGVAVHGDGYSGETPIVNRWYFAPGTDATDWHDYAVEWTPEEIRFEVDGRTTYVATHRMIENYGTWNFDTPKFVILNFALGGAYPEKNNLVAQPYPGLPPETVERVKAGELAMEVDWVRVWGPPAR
ncbi:glycoside hydrolase family 16 protein [Aurantiacibacter spongiae]|uniref:Glycoside hydrolase family 16 protein n=1 Tax=Aurantiacibacter spongiae TaxID=2488860 RepID=A0A3N5CU59_9SPHN|nr:glycoside hydrolase family 16 protein [Aurantiacibacter spongiae]RPF72247.1 glycoside hydrolase family 16 protein [Aurantiacibacter spongiae]